jgi:hypothetical protein
VALKYGIYYAESSISHPDNSNSKEEMEMLLEIAHRYFGDLVHSIESEGCCNKK